MTLTTIIQNKQKRGIKASLLKNYSALQNVLQKAAWDEGENISINTANSTSSTYTRKLKNFNEAIKNSKRLW